MGRRSTSDRFSQRVWLACALFFIWSVSSSVVWATLSFDTFRQVFGGVSWLLAGVSILLAFQVLLYAWRRQFVGYYLLGVGLVLHGSFAFVSWYSLRSRLVELPKFVVLGCLVGVLAVFLASVVFQIRAWSRQG